MVGRCRSRWLLLEARRARGLRARGPTALARAIVPVIVASVERAERLTISLESRGMGRAVPPTRLDRVPFGPGEWVLVVAAVGVGALGVGGAAAGWGIAALGAIEVSPAAGLALLAVAAVVLAVSVARILVLAWRA